MTPSESRSPERSRPRHRKGVLFCPDCTHTSPYDGDWDRTETSAVVRYHCPVCGACIQERPVFDREQMTPTVSAVSTTVAPTFGLSPTAVERWRRAWSSWTAAWARFVTKARSR